MKPLNLHDPRLQSAIATLPRLEQLAIDRLIYLDLDSDEARAGLRKIKRILKRAARRMRFNPRRING